MSLESINFKGTKAQNRRKWKHIFEELDARKITLGDVFYNNKEAGLKDIFNTVPDATLADMVGLRMYAEAILGGKVQAAEFIRDTLGEKPSTQIDMTTTTTPLSNISTDDLESLIKMAREYANGESLGTDA